MLIPSDLMSEFQSVGNRLYLIQQRFSELAKADISTVMKELSEGEAAPAVRAEQGFKTLVRLSRSLSDVDHQLRALYLEALALKAPPPVKRSRGRPPLPPGSPRYERKKRVVAKAPYVLQEVANQRVLDYFKSTLNAQDWTQVKSSAIAKATELPESTVSFAIASAVGSGVVVKKYSRHYMLAPQIAKA